MKIYMNNFVAAVRDWQRISGYSNRKIVGKTGSYAISLVEHEVKVSLQYGLQGKKILFFSDLHFGSVNFDLEAFSTMVAEINPDWIVFGGDLITYACFQEEAFAFLKEIFKAVPGVAKVAVYGNWDRRRKFWYPSSRWIDAYNKVGVHLLINENIELGGINFYGMDEPRIGSPEFNDKLFVAEKLNCIISHSIDPVMDLMPKDQFKGKQLFLCGHSHGGQIRFPFFGAVFTSTKYWKLFEYGHYYLPKKDIDLIMTSGIGTTRLPVRFCCEPEVVIVKFQNV